MLLKKEQKEKINKLIEKENIDIDELSNTFEEIFNPNKIYNEVLIPFSFIFSEEGLKLFRKIFASNAVEELTPKEVALELKVTKQYVSKLLRNGKLEGRIKDGKWLISRLQLEEFKKNRRR